MPRILTVSIIRYINVIECKVQCMIVIHYVINQVNLFHT